MSAVSRLARGMASACAIAITTANTASAQEPLTPREFCVQAEDGASARRICERDYERSLELYLRYGAREGYIKRGGEFSFNRVVKDLWSWRSLVGLPPKSPFLYCSNKGASGTQAYDFRAIWDCIAARDPAALRMDAI